MLIVGLLPLGMLIEVLICGDTSIDFIGLLEPLGPVLGYFMTTPQLAKYMVSHSTTNSWFGSGRLIKI